jgi:hypothetical protein
MLLRRYCSAAVAAAIDPDLEATVAAEEREEVLHLSPSEAGSFRLYCVEPNR